MNEAFGTRQHIAGSIPITVGVTGHRDIPVEDIPVLRRAVRQELDRIADEHPNSSLLFLSGLAEGADRIAAECALDAGWMVGAVLPLPQDDYETDFSSTASIDEFRRLLARAAWVRVVSSDDERERPTCYVALGRWLSRYAQVLLALWNGLPSDSRGGTAETAREFLEGIPDTSVQVPDAGPVIQICTRRERDRGLDSEPGRVVRHSPRPGGLAPSGELDRWAAVLKRIDTFNRDARRAHAHRARSVARVRSTLFNFAETDRPVPAAADEASWMYALADTLSTTTQSRRDRLMRLIFGNVVVALCAEQLYSGPYPQAWLLAIAVTGGLMAYVFYRIGLSEDLEARYLDYRALAEASRTQTYWKLAGVPDCAADHFLREQRDELEWIRQAMLTSELPWDNPGTATSETMRAIRSRWIEDQRAWLLGAHPARSSGGALARNLDLSNRWGQLARGLVTAGFVAVLLLLPFHVWWLPALEQGETVVATGTAIYGTLFALGGLCKVYQEIKAFAANARRYRRMGLVWSLVCNRLDASLGVGDLAAARAIILDTGKAALAENSDWLLDHRERPVNVPIG